MANLGTLDRMNNGVYGVANAITQNALKNGTWGDKLAALIGSYVGQRMGDNKYKKEQAKLDAIQDSAKNTEMLDTNSVITPSTMSQEDYDYIVNGNMPKMTGEGVIGEAPQDSRLLTSDFDTSGPKTQKIAFNPNYNMDYIEREARKQGIHSRVWDERKDGIQRDIVDNANAFYLPQIQAKLYGTKDNPATTDSILEGMNLLSELGKYSPDAAKAYQALAVNGLQGQANFERQKELQQIRANNQAVADARRLQNRIDYRNATANLTNNRGGSKGISYDPTKVANAGKRIQEIDEIVRDGGELTPGLRQEYNSHREYLNSVYAGQTGNQPSVANNTTTNAPGPAQQPQQKASDVVRGIFDSIDYGNYDDDKLADGKKFNFIKGTQAAVDTMRNAGANDDQIFKAIDATLAQKEKAGELPAGYREDFAHSMGRKTNKELNDEAIAAQERKALELDMKLNPQKYGIDPFSGVKYAADAVANGKPLWNLAGNYNTK